MSEQPKAIARRLLGFPPRPGTEAALEQGCTCPWLDNRDAVYGNRVTMVEDCPLHGRGSGNE